MLFALQTNPVAHETKEFMPYQTFLTYEIRSSQKTYVIYKQTFEMSESLLI